MALIVERLDPGGTSSLTRVLIRLTVPVQYNATWSSLVFSQIRSSGQANPRSA